MGKRGSRTTPERGASFAERLRRLREAAGFTQEELASRAGLTSDAIVVLERGERKRPYPHTVRSLADALELPDDERASLLASVPKRGAVPRTASATVPESALPTPPTPLVGREHDLEEVAGLLRGPGVRLLTLTGTGGVGKTRLALQAARKAAELFPDGAAFVALAPLGDPALVVPAIARSLGLREAGGQTPHQALRAYLSEKDILLVLDNFEHVLGAAPEVADLLGSCPRLRVLATSRAPLRVRGEQEYPVPPLALPASTRSPAVKEVLGSPSGRLFAERARAASPAFAITAENAGAVAAICWRLAGLPLALELAAAKVRYLDPAALLPRLDRALSAGWARDLPERQRTMRAALDWSHDLLSEPERLLLRRLSVFAGGFALEAAEAVGSAGEVEDGDDDVLELLGRLVEQSLVSVAEASPGEGTPRYGMLEPVRQYALERLEESGEATLIRRSHAAFFLALAERAYPDLRTERQVEWFERFDWEHDNLRAALSWLLEEGEAERVVRIGWAIWLFWLIRGHAGEGRRWMERVLAKGAALPAGARARALWVSAILSFVRGEMARAAPAANESLNAARTAGDSQTEIIALMLRGYLTLNEGDLDVAERDLTRGLELFHERYGRRSAAFGINGLAQVALARGDFDRAQALLADGEAELRVAGDWFTLTANLNTQALAARLRGDDERAGALLRESIGLAGRLRDAWGVVLCAAGLAGVAAVQGLPERAARLFGAAEALRERTGADVSWSSWRALNERDLADAREQLDSETLDTAWAEGRAMTLEGTVAEALAQGE